MNDPATATVEVWQTVFVKDTGKMAQGRKQDCQIETNSMFIMMHDKINFSKRVKKLLTLTQW